MPTTMDRRERIERWFAHRGVPQLIEGYTSEQRMDARALPLLTAWVALATAASARRPSGAPTDDVMGVIGALAGTGVTLVALLWLRRRPPFGHRHFDLADIALLGIVPGVATALVRGSVGVAFGTGSLVLTGVGLIYLVIGFGLLELAGWALGHLRAQLGQIATLVARTLPILLILVVFLLFASELWQAAHTLGPADLVAILGLLLAVATLLIVTRARAELAIIEAGRDWQAILPRLSGTPAEMLASAMPASAAAGTGAASNQPPAVPPEQPRPLRWQERMNLVLQMLVSQLVQSLFVAAVVAMFLVALGLLAIPASVQETWVGLPVRAVLGFDLLGEPRLVSVELLTAAGLLGGVSALYFTGLALTDAAYRTEFHEHVVGDIEQIVAVHTAYLALPELREAREPSTGGPD